MKLLHVTYEYIYIYMDIYIYNVYVWFRDQTGNSPQGSDIITEPYQPFHDTWWYCVIKTWWVTRLMKIRSGWDSIEPIWRHLNSFWFGQTLLIVQCLVTMDWNNDIVSFSIWRSAGEGYQLSQCGEKNRTSSVGSDVLWSLGVMGVSKIRDNQDAFRWHQGLAMISGWSAHRRVQDIRLFVAMVHVWPASLCLDHAWSIIGFRE